MLGKSVIAYTFKRFQSHEEIDAIEVVWVEGYIEKVKKISVGGYNELLGTIYEDYVQLPLLEIKLGTLRKCIGNDEVG